MTEQELQAEFQKQFAALAHKHATVSYLVIGVLALVLMLAGVGGYFGLKMYDAQLARAEKMEEQYNADRKSWQDQMAANVAQRVQDSAQQQQVIAELAKAAAKPLPPVVVNGLQPGASAKDAASALATVYNKVPTFGQPAAQGDQVDLTVPQAQLVIQSKADLDKTLDELTGANKLYALEQDKTKSLTVDLTGAQKTLGECQTSLDSYKKLAKKSKFRKFLDGAEKVLIFAAGAYAGHKL